MASNRKYNKYAFFSAHTTVPNFEQPELFFANEIKNIFTSYRNSLQVIKKHANAGSYLRRASKDMISYEPVGYCLFGDFDMAVFSLIDDFSFASKKFKPRAGGSNFKYQINTGIIPSINVYVDKHSKMDLFEEEMRNFFQGKDVYPFTGITSLKLNNAMLIGIGQQFLELMKFYLVVEIDKFIEKKKRKSKGFRMFYIINENLGWNELSIYFFANSLHDINEISLYVKRNTLGAIRSELEKLNTSKYNEEKINECCKVFEAITQQSLLAHFIDDKRNGNACTESHPIIASTTTFGFHVSSLSSLTKEGTYKNSRIRGLLFRDYITKELNKKCVIVSWNVKPGHEQNLNEGLKKVLPGKLLKILGADLFTNTQAGKYAYVFPSEKVSLLEYFILIKSITNNIPAISQHVIKLNSKVQFTQKLAYRHFDQKLHYTHNLDALKIKQEDVELFISKLRQQPVAHTIKGQVENLITNLNDGITDPLMFNYFVGLKKPMLIFLDEILFYKRNITAPREKTFIPFVDQQFQTIKLDADRFNFFMKADMIYSNHSALIEFIERWNKAYWNRHFHGYHFTEINDFNIEHHGGVQQILFCYDTVYKIISHRIYGLATREPFVTVRIHPYITSTQFNVNINFTHLFKPAIYACECVHEASNDIIPYLVSTCGHYQYEFLLNPKSLTDPIQRRVNEKFEDSIKIAVSPKNIFELSYLEQFFGLNTIRYLFTEYVSFMLAYNYEDSYSGFPVPGKGEASETTVKNLKLFYHTHWFLFLTRSEIFVMNRNGKGWYLEASDFRFLFIRWNLMFYLMADCSFEQLQQLSMECPSADLKILWESEKENLLNFVRRLGDAIRKEFGTMSTGEDNVSLLQFKQILHEEVFEKNKLTGKNKEFYDQIIRANYQLISTFHAYFSKDDSFNTVIRGSRDTDIKNIETNVDFYPGHSRKLFLDPKGNLFSISEKMRLNVLAKNIDYLKNIWNISMIKVLGDYIENKAS